MSGLFAHGVRRRRSACLASVVLVGAVGLALSGCSQNKEVVQAANAPIAVSTNQMFITIQNKAGVPLLDIQATIQPVGAPPFTHLVSRLEDSEKLDMSLNDFSSRDGTTFSLRLVKPKTVRITAKDLTNKTYEVQVPWQ